MATTATKSQKTTTTAPKLLEEILEEIRLLRAEVMSLFPQEDLDDYANPERVKRSYDRATKRYPPVISIWK